MQGIHLITLSPLEIGIVRRICKLQISSVTELTTEEHIDVLVFESINDFDNGTINSLLLDSIRQYRQVLNDPRTFCKLSKQNLVIFRHLLTSYIANAPALLKAKDSIQRKLDWLEQMTPNSMSPLLRYPFHPN